MRTFGIYYELSYTTRAWLLGCSSRSQIFGRPGAVEHQPPRILAVSLGIADAGIASHTCKLPSMASPSSHNVPKLDLSNVAGDSSPSEYAGAASARLLSHFQAGGRLQALSGSTVHTLVKSYVDQDPVCIDRIAAKLESQSARAARPQEPHPPNTGSPGPRSKIAQQQAVEDRSLHIGERLYRRAVGKSAFGGGKGQRRQLGQAASEASLRIATASSAATLPAAGTVPVRSPPRARDGAVSSTVLPAWVQARPEYMAAVVAAQGTADDERDTAATATAAGAAAGQSSGKDQLSKRERTAQLAKSSVAVREALQVPGVQRNEQQLDTLEAWLRMQSPYWRMLTSAQCRAVARGLTYSRNAPETCVSLADFDRGDGGMPSLAKLDSTKPGSSLPPALLRTLKLLQDDSADDAGAAQMPAYAKQHPRGAMYFVLTGRVMLVRGLGIHIARRGDMVGSPLWLRLLKRGATYATQQAAAPAPSVTDVSSSVTASLLARAKALKTGITVDTQQPSAGPKPAGGIAGMAASLNLSAGKPTTLATGSRFFAVRGSEIVRLGAVRVSPVVLVAPLAAGALAAAAANVLLSSRLQEGSSGAPLSGSAGSQPEKKALATLVAHHNPDMSQHAGGDMAGANAEASSPDAGTGRATSDPQLSEQDDRHGFNLTTAVGAELVRLSMRDFMSAIMSEHQKVSHRVMHWLRANIPAFATWPDMKLAALARCAEVDRYAAGEVLARQGDAANGVWIVMRGLVTACANIRVHRSHIVPHKRGGHASAGVVDESVSTTSCVTVRVRRMAAGDLLGEEALQGVQLVMSSGEPAGPAQPVQRPYTYVAVDHSDVIFIANEYADRLNQRLIVLEGGTSHNPAAGVPSAGTAVQELPTGAGDTAALLSSTEAALPERMQHGIRSAARQIMEDDSAGAAGRAGTTQGYGDHLGGARGSIVESAVANALADAARLQPREPALARELLHLTSNLADVRGQVWSDVGGRFATRCGAQQMLAGGVRLPRLLHVRPGAGVERDSVNLHQLRQLPLSDLAAAHTTYIRTLRAALGWMPRMEVAPQNVSTAAGSVPDGATLHDADALPLTTRLNEWLSLADTKGHDIPVPRVTAVPRRAAQAIARAIATGRTDIGAPMYTGALGTAAAVPRLEGVDDGVAAVVQAGPLASARAALQGGAALSAFQGGISPSMEALTLIRGGELAGKADQGGPGMQGPAKLSTDAGPAAAISAARALMAAGHVTSKGDLDMSEQAVDKRREIWDSVTVGRLPGSLLAKGTPADIEAYKKVAQLHAATTSASSRIEAMNHGSAGLSNPPSARGRPARPGRSLRAAGPGMTQAAKTHAVVGNGYRAKCRVQDAASAAVVRAVCATCTSDAGSAAALSGANPAEHPAYFTADALFPRPAPTLPSGVFSALFESVSGAAARRQPTDSESILS